MVRVRVSVTVMVRVSKVLGLGGVWCQDWGSGKITVRVVIKVTVRVRETIMVNTTQTITLTHNPNPPNQTVDIVAARNKRRKNSTLPGFVISSQYFLKTVFCLQVVALCVFGLIARSMTSESKATDRPASVKHSTCLKKVYLSYKRCMHNCMFRDTGLRKNLCDKKFEQGRKRCDKWYGVHPK